MNQNILFFDLSRWKQEGLRSCDFLGRGPWGFGRLGREGWLGMKNRYLQVPF